MSAYFSRQAHLPILARAGCNDSYFRLIIACCLHMRTRDVIAMPRRRFVSLRHFSKFASITYHDSLKCLLAILARALA